MRSRFHLALCLDGNTVSHESRESCRNNLALATACYRRKRNMRAQEREHVMQQRVRAFRPKIQLRRGGGQRGSRVVNGIQLRDLEIKKLSCTKLGFVKIARTCSGSVTMALDVNLVKE